MRTGATRDKVARSPVGDRAARRRRPAASSRYGTAVGRRLGQRAAARRADREAGGPRQVDERVRLGLVEVDELGPGCEQQPGRHPQHAEQAGGEHDDDRQPPRAVRQLQHDERHRADGQPERARSGTAPRRSAARPAPGAMTASTPAAAKNVAPSARPLAPSAARRSGTSTSSTPKAAAGSAVSHMPASIERWRSAAAGAVRTSEPRGAGMVIAQAPSATPKSTVVEKAASRPIAVASAPTTGPSCDAEDGRAEDPADRPRRGARAAPRRPPRPCRPPTCTRRRRPAGSARGRPRRPSEPKAKARPLTDMSVRPASTVALTPDARGQPAAGQRADQRAGGVGAGQHAGAVLAEVRTRRRGRAAAARSPRRTSCRRGRWRRRAGCSRRTWRLAARPDAHRRAHVGERRRAPSRAPSRRPRRGSPRGDPRRRAARRSARARARASSTTASAAAALRSP